MTTKRRLVPESEVKGMLELLRSCGIDLKSCVIDIRGDGVAVSPPKESAAGTVSAYDAWKAKDQSRDRSASRK